MKIILKVVNKIINKNNEIKPISLAPVSNIRERASLKMLFQRFS